MHETIVIGGGVIGLAIADRLARDGQNVVILDHRPVPTIASWAAAGVLPPPARGAKHDPLEQLRTASHDQYEEWVSTLQSETGFDLELSDSGGLYVARYPGEIASLRAAVAQWRTDGIDIHEVAPADLRNLETNLAPLPASAAVFRAADEKQVRPPRILRALTASLAKRAVSVRNVATRQIIRNDDGSFQILTNGPESLYAKRVCVAAGPWTYTLMRPFGFPALYVEPLRGQMVMWQGPAPLVRHVINEGPRYLLSRKDGLVLAGSTVEEEGFCCETTTAGQAELVEFGERLVPSLRNCPIVETWAGLRPGCHDGLPYLGEMNSAPGLFVAAGHFRSGIHLAPITAECIARLITGQTPAIDLTPFAPDRN